MPTNLHRYCPGYLHFITTSGYQRRPLLGRPQHRDLFLEVMEQIQGLASALQGTTSAAAWITASHAVLIGNIDATHGA